MCARGCLPLTAMNACSLPPLPCPCLPIVHLCDRCNPAPTRGVSPEVARRAPDSLLLLWSVNLSASLLAASSSPSPVLACLLVCLSTSRHALSRSLCDPPHTDPPSKLKRCRDSPSACCRLIVRMHNHAMLSHPRPPFAADERYYEWAGSILSAEPLFGESNLVLLPDSFLRPAPGKPSCACLRMRLAARPSVRLRTGVFGTSSVCRCCSASSGN